METKNKSTNGSTYAHSMNINVTNRIKMENRRGDESS